MLQERRVPFPVIGSWRRGKKKKIRNSPCLAGMQGTGILRSLLPRGGLVSFGSRRWLDWWLERLECLNFFGLNSFLNATPPTSFGGLVLISFSACHPLTPGIEMRFCLEWVAFIGVPHHLLNSHLLCSIQDPIVSSCYVLVCPPQSSLDNWTIIFKCRCGRRVRTMSTYSSKQMKTQICISYSLTLHLFGGSSDIRVETTILGLL